ncbi:MAG: RIP metalloprotease RseP [Deltaproteobacteria bacterium]|nr:RIP metalloprotease RseP [Deltaproteobacteria bacterium]MBN2687890.1 RIP metalloprotease RseP [Deltaproteobacteria bacterium]
MIGINIISVIILLGVLIFVHELGHFLVAKWFGVGVLKFSLGFGPRLIGRKIGETEYLISVIPLGGYVKLLGESESDDLSPEDERRSFQRQRVFKRMGIVVAGPVFNFLFAMVAFTFIYTVGVPAHTSRIGTVLENSPASAAGIRPGDVVAAIDGRGISKWSELANTIYESSGRELALTVDRDGVLVNVTVVPEKSKGRNIFGEELESYKIGVSVSDETVIERANPFRAFAMGMNQTWWFTKLTVLSIVKIIQRVISPKTLGGPIMIAQMSGQYAKQGLIPFLFFMAILSINLGVLNLLPIPVLDGGHLLFYGIEALTGREVNLKWREMAQQLGFFILILLMIFVFYNDIVRIIGE